MSERALSPPRGDRPRGPRRLPGDEALGRPAAARRGREGARPRARLSSSRTSRPGTSTPSRARRSSSSCGGSRPSTGRRSSSSRTTSGSRPGATGSSRWWTGGSARTSGTRGPEGRKPPGTAGRLSRRRPGAASEVAKLDRLPLQLRAEIGVGHVDERLRPLADRLSVEVRDAVFRRRRSGRRSGSSRRPRPA